jgi:vancomycin resistance protein YoaR
MKKYIRILFAAAALIVLSNLAAEQVQAQSSSTTIEQGIYIGNVDVSGMTEEQATESIQEYINEIGQAEITFEAMNDNSYTVSADEIGLTWTNSDVVSEAVQIGKSGNIIQRYKVLKDLQHENMVLPLTFAVDRQAVLDILSEECEKFNVKAVDATLSRSNGEFVIEPGQTGVVIDEEASADAIVAFMTGEWDYQDASIDLIVETDEPRGTEEELSQVKDLLGSFTTSYSTSSANRSGNVANGCRLINGTTLYPGDEFSVYEAISPFTEENGYYMAGSYSGGLVVDSLGGGICQVSTTLYNAVIRAELDVTERSNHSMIVTYVDPSADAAIAGTSKDFKFVNSLDHPVYIEGYTQDKKITFNIYGVETRPSNRKVTFESEVLTTTPAEGEKVVGDSSKPVGYISVQSAHTGYTAQLWKVVTVDGVEESREVFNKSTYKAVPRTAAVGTATSDANVSNVIQAAIATQSIDYVKAVLAGTSTTSTQDAAAAAAQQAAAQQAAQQAAAQQAAEAAAAEAAAQQAAAQQAAEAAAAEAAAQ